MHLQSFDESVKGHAEADDARRRVDPARPTTFPGVSKTGGNPSDCNSPEFDDAYWTRVGRASKFGAYLFSEFLISWRSRGEGNPHRGLTT